MKVFSRRASVIQAAIVLSVCGSAPAATARNPAAATASVQQSETDAYSRYELLDPGSGKFRILYEVTATTPGGRFYFNPIRKGSIASDERVTDRATGKPLRFDVVGGEVARAGGVRDAEDEDHYIRVALARPVPSGGEARLLIDKTYADPKSFRAEGDMLIFDRSLGVKRNAIVLPLGFELVSVNYPSQVLREKDGRFKLTFWNISPAPTPLVVKAKRSGTSTPSTEILSERFQERASQSREIVYYLREPETHSFDLTHDYTESRPGVGVYTNIVRAGSRVSNPSAVNLDNGQVLRSEILKGAAIAKAGGDAPDWTPETEAVLFHFDAPSAGETRRIRISETYTDPQRYRRVNDTLIWDRSFGRPVNAVVLPLSWVLSNSSAPATISMLPDGRVRLDFINPRTDELSVLITASRRK